MTRRTFLTVASAAAAQPRRRPNVVVLLADDLGYGELGFQGNKDFPTPHLDALANAGTRFTNGYVTAPFCCPSRAGLMTGRIQTRFGHEFNATGATNLQPHVGLPLSETTLASHLKPLGYRTGMIGKWHLGTSPDRHPLSRGFDEFFGFLQEGHFYYPPPFRGAVTRLRPNEPPYDEKNPLMRGREPVEESAYLTDALARESRSFIRRNAQDPFFLYLAFNAIHSPMQAPVPLLKEFEDIRDEQRRLFAAMTRAMDNAVGAVREELRARGLEQDTLIFFLSDNGGPTAELTSSNKPLRGGKGQLWEGGIRVPFTMTWPGTVRAGGVNHTPVTSLDLAPTIWTAAGGGKWPAQWDGTDLRRHPAQPRDLFWRYGQNVALRAGEWKIVRQGSELFELYNLSRDPAETQDQAPAQPAIAADLRDRLQKLDAQMAKPLWGGR